VKIIYVSKKDSFAFPIMKIFGSCFIRNACDILINFITFLSNRIRKINSSKNKDVINIAL
jgi:hypothetical protein